MWVKATILITYFSELHEELRRKWKLFFFSHLWERYFFDLDYEEVKEDLGLSDDELREWLKTLQEFWLIDVAIDKTTWKRFYSINDDNVMKAL